MIQNHTDRVLWIDFDRAPTFPENEAVPERKLEWMRDEKALADEFFDDLAQDYKDGKLSRARSWYYS
ncbi:hypothetical protein DTO271D3_6750 [Paecilomyces variotii]|nr:hypothetical protein DTO169E5_4125 [Paecilomyces variotii]KAJ9312990.1 hypothetical protein DTO271D3_6750 [Paecilomyces variotii]KAJ9347794.1 hypothetical protein DTO027B9_8862 [Paecilomyces variotii]KAJ9349081.1 hypothetical protein DTO280E4_9152 [Paecilomyces variotii]